MFFLNTAKDQPLYQEILRESVINAALWESLELPGEGYLMDVLISNQERISQNAWIDWLIRKHNCTRVPALIPDYPTIKALPRDLINQCLTGDCYPLLVQDNHLFVGIGRPDYPDVVDALAKHFKKTIVYHNALPMSEIRDIRALCQRALNSI